MDEELLELQRQLEVAQKAKSSVRLSERNVVELIQKLQELGIIDFELLHTVSGKEYITNDQLRNEVLGEIKKRGRVSLIDIVDAIGVDLFHIEKQANHIVSEDSGLTVVQGEIISNAYWDIISEEINERLQECSQISLSEVATQLNVGSELIASVLGSRVGTKINGRLEGGQLYTPAYVSRISAMVRGAARGVTMPVNLSLLWNSLQQLLEIDGAIGAAFEASFFQSVFNGMAKEGDILGSLHAGTRWTPAVFTIAQKECIDAFLYQNSFISYESLQKLCIFQPIQYLQSSYPEGIPLVTIFIHPSMVEMLDAAVGDVIEGSGWMDSLSVLPSVFMLPDASQLLSLCPTIQTAVKSNRALILHDSCIFSNDYVKKLLEFVEKEMENIILSGSVVLQGSLNTIKVHDSNTSIHSNVTGVNTSSKQDKESKRKGKSVGSSKFVTHENNLIIEESNLYKSKKNQRKGKDASFSHRVDSKVGAKKDADRLKSEDMDFPSEELIAEKVLVFAPDFEGLENPRLMALVLATYMRPMLLNSWKEKRKALFAENSVKMKQLFDNLQIELNKSFLSLQLYEKALDLFEDDQTISVILHRYLLRTVAITIADTLLFNLDVHNKLKNGAEARELHGLELSSLSSRDRMAIAEGLSESFSSKAFAMINSLEGKSVETFKTALDELAEESGLFLKKLDKKSEKALLHSYSTDLMSQISAESDPLFLLPKVVSALYIKVCRKALQAPGRAISVAITRLKDKLDEASHKTLMNYHAETVSLLSLMSAAGADNPEKNSEGVASQRKLLASLMPELKNIVLTSTQKHGVPMAEDGAK